MNWRRGAAKWDGLNFTTRGNWLAVNGFSYGLATYSFNALPNSVQSEFMKLSKECSS